jgi:uncharacterized metal-binding protein YceD (DUF177 family)
MDKGPRPGTGTGEAPLIERHVKVADIEDGEEGLITATPSECRAIAKMLDLVSLERLALTYRLRSEGGGRIGLTGTLAARMMQICVVSLEPVQAHLEVPVEWEFWPPASIAALDGGVEDKDHALREWPEPIVDGKIDLGTVIYETLATALEPYPRREGAQLEWQAAPESGGEPEGPFAALARLKQR